MNSLSSPRLLPRTMGLLALTVAGLSAPAPADATVTWIGGSGDWDVGANWDTGVVPGAGEDVRLLPGPSPYEVHYVPGTTPPPDLQYLTIGGRDNSQTVTLRQDAESLHTTSAEYVGGGWFGSSLSSDGPGQGVHVQTGGSNDASALFIGAQQYTHGRYELSGGALTGGSVTVGVSGTGEFVQSGGTNTSALVLGENPGATGTYELSGTGTLQAGFMTIGKSGTGTFVQTGGVSSGTLTLGDVGGTGSFMLAGGRLESDGERIGNINGNATFVQTGGDNIVSTPAGFPTPASLTLCDGWLCNATYTLDGAASTITTPYERVASAANSTATFTQNDGTNSIAYDLVIANGSNTNGTFNLNGGTLSANFLNVGGQGTGLFLQNGGAATVNHSIGVNGTSELRTTNGSLGADMLSNRGRVVVEGGSLTATTTFNWATGTLMGTGALTSNVTSQGTVAPGLSPGSLTIQGDFTNWNDAFNTGFDTALLDIEIAGYDQGTSYDALFVTGSAHIAGELSAQLLGGFDPLAGSTFSILHADGGLIGTFATTSLPTLSGAKSWNVLYTSNDVLLEVVGGPAAADEPGALALAMLGIGAGLRRRRARPARRL